jgi:hypothetical protein
MEKMQRTTGRTNQERRKHNRYRLEVPVIFSWRDAQGERREGVGLTRVLSTHGAFVLTATPPPVNASIALKVLIPRVGAAGPHMFLLGEGTVVRVDAFSYPDASASFAVAGRSFVLNRDEAALSERAVIKSRALTSGVEVSARQRPR